MKSDSLPNPYLLNFRRIVDNPNRKTPAEVAREIAVFLTEHKVDETNINQSEELFQVARTICLGQCRAMSMKFMDVFIIIDSGFTKYIERSKASKPNKIISATPVDPRLIQYARVRDQFLENFRQLSSEDVRPSVMVEIFNNILSLIEESQKLFSDESAKKTSPQTMIGEVLRHFASLPNKLMDPTNPRSFTVESFLEVLKSNLIDLKETLNATLDLEKATYVIRAKISEGELLREAKQAEEKIAAIVRRNTKTTRRTEIPESKTHDLSTTDAEETPATQSLSIEEQELLKLQFEKIDPIHANFMMIGSYFASLDKTQSGIKRSITGDERLNIVSIISRMTFTARSRISLEQLDEIIGKANGILFPKSKSFTFSDPQQLLNAALIMCYLHNLRCEMIHQELKQPKYNLMNENFTRPSMITAEDIDRREDLLSRYTKASEDLASAIGRVNTALANLAFPENSEGIHWSLRDFGKTQKDFETLTAHHENQDQKRQEDHKKYLARKGQKRIEPQDPEKAKLLAAANKALMKHSIIDNIKPKKDHSIYKKQHGILTGQVIKLTEQLVLSEKPPEKMPLPTQLEAKSETASLTESAAAAVHDPSSSPLHTTAEVVESKTFIHVAITAQTENHGLLAINIDDKIGYNVSLFCGGKSEQRQVFITSPDNVLQVYAGDKEELKKPCGSKDKISDLSEEDEKQFITLSNIKARIGGQEFDVKIHNETLHLSKEGRIYMIGPDTNDKWKLGISVPLSQIQGKTL